MGFSKRFISAQMQICGSQKILVRKYLSNHLFALMILLFESYSKDGLEDCVHAQINANEYNLANNSGVEWESERKAQLSHRATCASTLDRDRAE